MTDYSTLTGELWPGAYGWLPLDNAGVPSGPATLQPPPPPATACFVYCNPNFPQEPGYGLTTATGAPITDNMTPNADNRIQLESQYKSAPKPPKWDEEQHNRKQFRPN